MKEKKKRGLSSYYKEVCEIQNEIEIKCKQNNFSRDRICFYIQRKYGRNFEYTSQYIEQLIDFELVKEVGDILFDINYQEKSNENE